MAILSKIFGDANKRSVGQLQPVVDQVSALKQKVAALPAEEFITKIKDFNILS